MRKKERGVALIMVILVLLVLTVLGITAAMLMTQEDRISARQDQQKAALYAAEVGLRRGEQILMGTPFSKTAVNAFLNHVSVATTVAAPDTVPIQPAPWDIRHLGTYLTDGSGSSNEIANREITQMATNLADSSTFTFNKIRAFYSVYVRNNPEDRDASGVANPLDNNDTRVRLVSIGFITDNRGVDGSGNAKVLAVKILEEEFNWSGFSTSQGFQADMYAGATNSGVWQGTTRTGP
jgi:hypothetical protein